MSGMTANSLSHFAAHDDVVSCIAFQFHARRNMSEKTVLFLSDHLRNEIIRVIAYLEN